MAKSKLVKANEKIAEGVTTGFKKMSDGVTTGFKKISDGVVGGYTKIEDKFVEEFLTHDGETVSEAKARLKEEEEQRKALQDEKINSKKWEFRKRLVANTIAITAGAMLKTVINPFFAPTRKES